MDIFETFKADSSLRFCLYAMSHQRITPFFFVFLFFLQSTSETYSCKLIIIRLLENPH